MTLSEFIQRAAISFLEVEDRDEALKRLVDSLADAGHLPEKEEFLDAILKREKIVSTGIGMGVAIPHAKLPDFDRFFLVVGLQKGKEGIEWDALDGAPVRLIFMIGGPASEQTEYLKVLSRLTAAIKDEERRKNLLTAKTKEDVVALFEGC
ncbi:PTS sugar transporter subunit IIA [Candidatus Neptunochlamydia vexilliferae]|uniref:Fructose-specific phosphotransferase enzyme IIA component n=1 Tax=Candidatus Neptunichlamydia vexilliferae TaxID=1651774 RepID=A0ABS0AYY8_9BACT|nr:PTS sugar transporter subunit IIA [Candidatus Neptunochlamydia vexilliferae]MBF5059326.1 Fructose-specific phosphotransferase enzyme IIA component [Candidatus Neptunochlamydia vexilliferae]